MWWDESLSHYRATKPIPYLLSNQIHFSSGERTVRTVDNHPPLYFVLLRSILLAAGDTEFAMRWLSMAWGVLIVPLVYQCGRRLFGAASGLMGALLASLSPLYLWYQQEIRPYTMVTALGLLSFCFLLRLTAVTSAAESRRCRAVWATLYVLSVAAMLTTHYLAFLLLAAEVAILLHAWLGGRRRLGWAVLAVCAAAGAVLWWGLKALPKQATLPSFGFLPLWTLVNDVFQQFTLGLYADALWPLRWVAVGLLAAALAVLFTQHRRLPWQHTLWALLCFALPVAAIYVVSLFRPAYMNVRHLIFASPTYYLLLGAGVAEARRRWVRIPLGVAWAAMAAGMILSTALYFGAHLAGKADHRAWGRYLSDRLRPGDAVIVNPAPISELYEYYVDSAAPWVGLPALEPQGSEVMPLYDLAETYDRVWIAHSSTPGWADTRHLPRRWMDLNATQIASANFSSATTSLGISAYRRRLPLLEALPEGVLPLALRFGEQLALHAYSSPTDGVTSGHVLQLSLYWQATRPLEGDVRVSLSLSDDAGLLWASADYAPVQGVYPATEWPTEQIVRDDVDLEVPAGVPPGRYRINVSVYPADGSGPALAVRDVADGADRLLGLIVPIDEVEVTRPDHPPSDRDLPLGQRIGCRLGPLTLLGHNYGGGAYRPGDIALLDAYWRANRVPRRDVTFELQLLDEEGEVLARREVLPAGDYLPTSWQRGEVVRGQYRFRIPVDAPAGRYVLALGEGGRRAAPVPLSTLTVGIPAGERTFEIPPMALMIGANLGDRVELIGLDLETETIRAGEVVSYTLYWRALDGMHQNYTVFNHLVGADGQTWGQWDSQPQGGGMPTTRWVPGQVVADRYQVPVAADAPAGTLEIRVGMYDLQGMTRLPVHEENGAVVGDSVVAATIPVTGGGE
jgi:hypothetical protein